MVDTTNALYQANVDHGDLFTSNMFIDENMYLKLGEFEFSDVINNNNKYSNLTQTRLNILTVF